MLQLCIRVSKKARGVYQALPNRALVSPIEIKARVEVIEAKVQVGELSLVRDQLGPQLPAVTPRVFLSSIICVEGDTMGSVRDIVQGVSTVARKAISLGSVLS